jgi:fused signal recognition particle receptor
MRHSREAFWEEPQEEPRYAPELAPPKLAPEPEVLAHVETEALPIEPIVEETAPPPVETPVLEPEALAPEPAPEPVVAPEPEPVPPPAPVPVPVPAPPLTPVPAPVPVPAPPLTPVPAPASAPEPVLEPEPVPVPKPEPTPEPAPEIAAEKPNWWSRLRQGLARSSSSIGQGVADIFTKKKLSSAMLEDLEDVLVRADLGVSASARIAALVGGGRYDRQIAPEDVREILADEVERVLAPVARPLVIDASKKPFVILVVGVNGSGKTTTIGKLTAKLHGEGKSLMLAAGDTFRAAAIEQLRIWGERLNVPVIAREPGADAAGLAFDAIKAAREQNLDVLLMDTAGRLQNRAELMAELEKIVRVMKKIDPQAPHSVLLVLDATVGQNALSQVEIFGKTAGVTGLAMTKLDGTARGGILVAIAERFKMPVHFIGVGEQAEDLEPFEARDFARAIAGFDERDS